MSTSLPNLLIIGAPKCGTTSLSAYLDCHPAISMSAKKELHFFTKPDWTARRDWYEDQFRGSRGEVRGEATPHYAMFPRHPDVAPRIQSLIPDTKLIYLVRDPHEQIISWWTQLYSQGDRTPLEAYLRQPGWADSRLVCASRYAHQIERYLEFFPRSSLLVVDQSELKANRGATLARVFRFLEVDPDFASPQFDVDHNTRTEKYALTRFGMPAWNRVLGPALRRLPPRVRAPLSARTVRLLSRPIGAVPGIDTSLRPKVDALFAAEADRLRTLTGQQFASWSV